MNQLRIGDDDHDVGDRGCAACSMPYPLDCECGGLIHGTIDWEHTTVENYTRDLKCDRCHKKGRTTEKKWEPTEEVRRRAEEIAEKLTGKKWDFGVKPEGDKPE